MNFLQVEQEFFIGIQDVGINNEMTNKAFLEVLTNVTNVHGNLVGQGMDYKEKIHILWVVINWKLEVYQRPKSCETILARTWAQEFSGIRAYRDYEIINRNGEVISKATSTWIAINTENGKPIKLSSDLMDVFGREPQHKNFPDFKFTKTVNTDLPIITRTHFRINKSMIDCNKHVHNPVYLDLANEAMPENINETYFNNIEISYKKEITLHEEVLLEYAIDSGKHYVFIWDENRSTLHAVVLLY